MPGTSPVRFTDVHKTFRGHTGLAGATLEMQAGRTTVILGANGSGKTTLLRLSLGLLAPDRGEVQVFGESPDAHTRARIGFVPGTTTHPYEWMTVHEMIAFHRRYFPAWDDAWMRRVIERLEIDVLRRFVDLSQGQRRRVQLLCALSHRARLLVLDEPFAAVDPDTRAECRALVLAYLGEIEGSSVLMTSHDADDVTVLAGAVVKLRHGLVESIREVPHVA